MRTRPRRPGLYELCFTVLAALLACGCRGDRRTPAVLIVVDALRADHLSVYGYERDTAPTIARVAAEGVVFERAFTTAPKTTPAIASLFTGLYPYRHGLRALGQELAEENTTIAERFRDAGLETAGFASSTVMIDRLSGLGQGFSYWDDRMPTRENGRDNYERRAAATADAVVSYIERHGVPDFLFVHLIDPHGPYDPPAPWSGRFRSERSTLLESAKVPAFQRFAGRRTLESYIDAYDGEIAFADAAIARILAAIEAHGRYRESLVIVTADHGESLGEDGVYFRHGKTLGEASTRVPLIVKAPSGPSGRRIDAVASVVDVAATIADYAGIDDARGMDGRSLRALIEGTADLAGAQGRVVFSERVGGGRPLWGAHGRNATLYTDGCFGAGAERRPDCRMRLEVVGGSRLWRAAGGGAAGGSGLDKALARHLEAVREFELPFRVTWRYRPGDRAFIRRFVAWHNTRWKRYRTGDVRALESLGYVN